MPASALVRGRPYDLDYIRNAGWVQLLIEASGSAPVGGLILKSTKLVEDAARAMGAEHDVSVTYDTSTGEVISIGIDTMRANPPKVAGPNDWTVDSFSHSGSGIVVKFRQGGSPVVEGRIQELAQPLAELAQRTKEPVEVDIQRKSGSEVDRLKINRG